MEQREDDHEESLHVDGEDEEDAKAEAASAQPAEEVTEAVGVETVARDGVDDDAGEQDDRHEQVVACQQDQQPHVLALQAVQHSHLCYHGYQVGNGRH